MPVGVPFGTGGCVVAEPPPPQPLITAMFIVNSNSMAPKASLTAEARFGYSASALLRSSAQERSCDIARTQRIGRGLRGWRGRIEGDEGIINAFAVVLTLIATMAGAFCVTVTGEAGPVHMALGGAPEQFTATLS